MRTSSPARLLCVPPAGQHPDLVPGVGGHLVRLGSVQGGGDPGQKQGLALVVGDLVGQRRIPGEAAGLVEEIADLARVIRAG
jgi:hypothetical protein